MARQHLAARAQAPARSWQQDVRLWGLRAIGGALRLRPSPPPSRRGPRILVIRPDHLGDLLCATPALACLRQQRPDAHITAMVGPWGEPALAANPDIDALLTCPFPGFTRQPKSSAWAPYRVLAEYARQLRPLRFDAAIILRGDHWWGALLAAWADIPTRLGYDIAETRPFLTDVQAYVPGRHEVIQNLCLIDPDLAATTPDQWPSRFPLAVEDERWAVQLAASIGDPTAPLVAIHPGAGAPVKTWCTAAWAHVADALVEGRNARIVITGGASEHDLAESVAREMRHPASILAGQTSLGQLGALLGRCALVIGPDCGPLHLAVAVGAPTIHLFGPADARLFGPWGDPQQHRVLTSDWACIPCNRLDYPAAVLSEHGCVRDIDEESVWDAALEFLL